MNTFVHIKPIAAYKKVRYYSVSVGEDELSLFEKFIKEQQGANSKKLDHILNWIRIIGNNYGAQEHLFRSEARGADTSALPPQGIQREPAYIEHGKKNSNPLRLYTFRVNENIVFLFDGAIKTTRKAQDCPNVRKHFALANTLTAALQAAFETGDLKWNEDFDDFTYDENFTLSL